MKFLDDIKEETIIICDNAVKESILNLHKLIPIKMMTLKEFINNITFSYEEDAIIKLIKLYGFKYEVAKMYLDNLCYIEDKKYDNNKLDFLCEIKKKLDEEKLLKYNDNFRDFVKRTPIILYDIRVDKYLERILNGLNYQVIEREYREYDHTVYSFDSMEEECEYVANQICEKITDGVDPSKIKLMNVDKSYYNTLERIFSLFNLKVNIPYMAKLSSFDVTKKFIENYMNSDLETATRETDLDNEIGHEIIKIVNKYLIYGDSDLILYKLNNTEVRSKKYNNGIEIVDYLNYISQDDEYIYMLGFNDGVIPNSYNDTEYITDNICNLVGKDTIVLKNAILREEIVKKIKDIKNLVITYKEKDMTRSYYPSTLCSYFTVFNGDTWYNYSYSDTYNKIKLMSRYDDYIRYGYVSDDLAFLNNNFKINYNSYQNKYTMINRAMDKLTLSYSKMQIYNKCAFRYYLSEILKLDIFEENFSTAIGSMVHYVMEKCLSNQDMDTDKYAMEYLGDRIFSKKEEFFLKKYREALKGLLEETILEKEYSLFNQAMYEKKIEIDYGNNIKFVGIIDKILYYVDNDTTYISLVDYKTGHDEISLKYLKYGLDIQLPIYLYLATKLDFHNPVYGGFYLQRFNIKDQDYRLLGYSNSDKDILEVVDSNYDNSKIIKGMKTLKDGSFSRYTKVLSNEEMNNVKNEARDRIMEVIEKIKNNEFSINPKVIDGYNKGCEYCKFKDICNVIKSDMVEITIDTEVGDDNG